MLCSILFVYIFYSFFNLKSQWKDVRYLLVNVKILSIVCHFIVFTVLVFLLYIFPILISGLVYIVDCQKKMNKLRKQQHKNIH